MRGPLGALLLAVDKAKSKGGEESDEEEAPTSERGGDSEELAREALGEAFDALKKGDREAFVEAMVTGCMHAADC